MVDFRRGITALATFALFTGLAAAQVGTTGSNTLTCNTNVTVTPALRGEGYTEQTGDITITCTGWRGARSGFQHSVGQHRGVLQHDGHEPPVADHFAPVVFEHV